MKILRLALLQMLLLALFIPAASANDDSSNRPETNAEDTQPPPNDSDNDEGEPSDADDEGDGGFSADSGGGTLAGEEGDATVGRTATWAPTVPPTDPVTDETVSYDSGGSSSTSESEPADNCVEESPPEYNEEGDFYYSGYCIKWRVCGGERIDDVASGDIAGENTVGRYRSYLSEMVGYLASDSYMIDAGLGDVNSISDFLVTQGLGERPGDDLLPVFYWCANQDANGVYDPVDITSVTFSWDLTVATVYDIPGVRNDLFVQLTAKLDLYDPQVGAVPSIDHGYTFVQWPTWLFLENPLEEEHIYTNNDIDTVRIDLRATLLRVEWDFGSERVATCTPGEMLRYNEDVHDPVDDLPECHYIFTQIDTENLSTTIVYKIEEKILSRPSATLDAYPNIPWSDYLGTPTEIELTTTTADYETHSIVSVNAPQGVSTDELRARVLGSIEPGDG